MDDKQLSGSYKNSYSTRGNISKMLRGNNRMENHLYEMTGTR